MSKYHKHWAFYFCFFVNIISDDILLPCVPQYLHMTMETLIAPCLGDWFGLYDFWNLCFEKLGFWMRVIAIVTIDLLLCFILPFILCISSLFIFRNMFFMFEVSSFPCVVIKLSHKSSKASKMKSNFITSSIYCLPIVLIWGLTAMFWWMCWLLQILAFPLRQDVSKSWPLNQE